MGIFSRITEIVNANINAMLDKAEDPEKMVKLMIHEMEDTLTEVKSAAAEVVADRLRLNRSIETQTRKANEWDSRAALALDRGREDLAREAVEQRMLCTKQIEALNSRLAEVEGLVTQYQGDISRLEEKLSSARTRQRSLIANHQSAMNRRLVEEKIHRLNTSGAFARFEQFENRIDRWNAEAEVMQRSNTNLEQKFIDLKHGTEVDAELAKLKAKLNAPAKASVKSKEDPEAVAAK